MSFQLVEDRYRNTLQPMEWDSSAGKRMGVIFIVPWTWGGRLKSGVYLDHDGENLPATLGVIYAILHASPFCVLNLSRSQGGLMPGDLISYTRRATMKISELSLESDDATDIAWSKLGVVSRHNYPLLALAESEIQCRVDGVLADPWESAVANLQERMVGTTPGILTA